MKADNKSKTPNSSPARSGRLDTGWKRHPFLRSMSAEHLATLEQCAMMTAFKRGQEVFREGEIANRFYLILDGCIAVKTILPRSAPVVIDRLSGGEVLGWSWLFPPYGLHFTANAIKPTRAIFFYGTWLRDRCEEDHELGYELVKRVALVIVERLESASQTLDRGAT
jgi:CRP/FNR family transcriptional regulator, cyclic AMP receptor protein